MFEYAWPVDFAGGDCILFLVGHRFCRRWLMRHRLSSFRRTFPELPSTRSRPDCGALCIDPAFDVLRAFHHHAQHAARPPHRGPARRVRHGGDGNRRIVEFDVRHDRGHGAAGAAQHLIRKSNDRRRTNSNYRSFSVVCRPKKVRAALVKVLPLSRVCMALCQCAWLGSCAKAEPIAGEKVRCGSSRRWSPRACPKKQSPAHTAGL